MIKLKACKSNFHQTSYYKQPSVLLTCGVSRHLDDALAIHPSLPRVEGSDPHRHLDRGPGHVDSGRVDVQKSCRPKERPETCEGQ